MIEKYLKIFRKNENPQPLEHALLGAIVALRGVKHLQEADSILEGAIIRLLNQKIEPSCEMLLTHGDTAMDRGDYITAIQRLRGSRKSIHLS